MVKSSISRTLLSSWVMTFKRACWGDHIDKITKKANSTLVFLSRNISRFPTNITAICNISTILARPNVGYASNVWNPANKDTVNKIEAVQRRAARFAIGDYQRTSSVKSMLQQLQWQNLRCKIPRQPDDHDVPH